MSYDPKEYESCPYCGAEREKETAIVAEAVKSEEKAELVEKPAKQKEKTLKVSIPAGEKSGGSLKYILIGVAAVAIIAAVAFGFSAFGGSGATVPDKYATIQEAIDAAQDGDEIIVQMGVYRENIDYKGKNIIIRSIDPDDPAVVSSTIIDGDGQSSVVSFRSGEGEGAVLSGFTVIRGVGGILISGGSTPLIEKCSIEDNSAEFGAGLFIVDSNPVIRDNQIIANRADSGGGVFIEKSTPILEGNNIARNEARMGAGLFIVDSSPVIRDNQIIANRAARLGGGFIITGDSTPVINNNTIGGNFAGLNGGGFYIQESKPVIEDNTIIGNQAENGGGIIVVFILDPGLRLTGNTFESNLAYRAGGALYLVGSSPTFESNSFKDNTSEFLGGAVAVYDSAPIFIRNNFEKNSANNAGRGGAMWISNDSNLEISDPDDNIYLGNNPDDIFRE